MHYFNLHASLLFYAFEFFSVHIIAIEKGKNAECNKMPNQESDRPQQLCYAGLCHTSMAILQLVDPSLQHMLLCLPFRAR
jgi:hypothetical protein